MYFAQLNAREVLNRVKYTAGNLNNVRVEYISRGSPDNRGVLRGEEILRIGHSFVETAHKSIPYHRITAIYRDSECIFRRIRT